LTVLDLLVLEPFWGRLDFDAVDIGGASPPTVEKAIRLLSVRGLGYTEFSRLESLGGWHSLSTESRGESGSTKAFS
jgi:hypothetical protein